MPIAPATAQGAFSSLFGELEGSGSLDFQIDVTPELDPEIDARFFAHEPFGFDLDTVRALGTDAAALLESLATGAWQTATQEPWRLLPWLLVLALAVGAVAYDARVRRWFAGLAKRVVPEGTGRSLSVRRAVVRSTGLLAVPALAWGLSYIPVQGLFDSAAWTRALSDAIGLFVLYRVVVIGVQLLLGPNGIGADADARESLRRAALQSARLIIAFAIASHVVVTIGYREDVGRLSEFLLRLSITLLSVRLYTSRTQIAALLPDEGSDRYLRFRRVFVHLLSYIAAISVLLLGLWTAGFTRAASTILVRSYGLIALFTVGALLQRWFDRVSQQADDHPDSFTHRIVREIDGFARLCLLLAFGWALLSVLGLDVPVTKVLRSVRVEAGSSVISLLGVTTGVAVFAIAVLASRLYRVLADVFFYPALDIEVGAGYAINTAVHYFVVTMAFGLGLTAIGIDLAALTVFLGALGVGIGFGLQDMARNFAAGFVLLFGRAVQKGDLITANNDYYGVVEEIGARVVKVRTRDNTELMIPSNELVNSTIVNWTHDNPYVRLHIEVGVSYASDVDEVTDALLRAARAFEHTSYYRPPDVWFTSFGDSAIVFELLLWIDARAIDPQQARGKVLFPIWRELKKRDIEIPFPQRDIHVRTWSEPTAAGPTIQAPGERETSGDGTAPDEAGEAPA